MPFRDPDLVLDREAAILRWIVDAMQLGVIVVDAETRVLLMNNWILRHAGLAAEAIGERRLAEVFPEIRGGRFEQAVAFSLKNNCPSVVSQTLNRSPLPLFKRGADSAPERILQAIQIIPARARDGSRETLALIQVSDVSTSVKRENLLRQQTEEMRLFSNTDGLTGIANRRRFGEYIEGELRRAHRTERSLSLILFDIDHFKRFNDTYGHPAGDHCLKSIAETAGACLRRPADLIARYGGEEFAVILPETGSAGALALAEEIRQAAERMELRGDDNSPSRNVTLSLGIACWEPGDETTLSRLIAKADLALYRAKAGGRNCSVVFTEDVPG